MAFKKIYPESHFNIYDFLRLTTTNILSDLWHAAHERVYGNILFPFCGSVLCSFTVPVWDIVKPVSSHRSCARRSIMQERKNKRKRTKGRWNRSNIKNKERKRQ